MNEIHARAGVTAEQTVQAGGTQAAEYLARLQRLSCALFGALTAEDVLNGIASEAFSGLDAAGSICLLTEEGAHLEAACVFGPPPLTPRPPARIPLDAPVPIAEAARTGQSLLLHSFDEYHARYPHAGSREDSCAQQGAFAAIPLHIQGDVLGAISVSFAQRAALNADERTFMETVAQMGALALERQRLAQAERRARADAVRTEEQLAAEKQGEKTRARNFFDNVTDGFVAYNQEWRVLYANDAAAAAVRTARADLEGKVIWELFPGLEGSEYADACRQAMSDHAAVHREDFWTSLAVWFETHIFPTETGVAVMFRDITERKRTEEMLSRQTELLKVINALFLQLANVNDPDTILESVVETVVRALGIDGCTMTEIDVDRDRSEVLRACCVGRAPITGVHAISDQLTPEWIAWYQQGKTRVVEDTASDIHASAFYEKHYAPLQIGALVSVPFLRSGRWTGTMGVYTHRPRRWQMQEIAFIEAVAQRAWLSLANARLFQAERERSEQLSRAILEVHHRVKNNLQAVSALLEMQLSPGLTSLPVEAVLDSLSQIKTIALVHDLLAGDRPMGAVNIALVLTNLADLLSTGVRRSEQALRIQVEAEPVWMSTKSATSLSLAVNELLTNAAKHYKQNGKEEVASHASIKVRLERQNQQVLVVVQDHGPGFPPGFDPGLHANLGLQLVLTLVEHDLHGVVSFANHFDPTDAGQPAGGRVEITFCEQSVPE